MGVFVDSFGVFAYLAYLCIFRIDQRTKFGIQIGVNFLFLDVLVHELRIMQK